MRQFRDFKECLNEVKRDLREMGVIVKTKSVQNKNIEGDDSMATYELEDYTYIVTSPRVEDIPEDYLDLEWCKAEFNERINGAINPGEAWKLRRALWEPMLNKVHEFDYFYPERIATSLDDVIAVLKLDPATRRAFLPIWDIENDMQNVLSTRVPCSLGYHFKFRQGKLNMTYLLRSSDYFEHIGNDLWLAVSLLNHVSKKCDMPVGHFTHWIGSLHVFAKDVAGVF